MNSPNLVLSVCVVLFLMAGCAAGRQGVNKSEITEMGEQVYMSFTIRPSGSFEECIEIYPGSAYDYEFDSTDFVNFNVHYHGAEKVYYPVRKMGIMMGEGILDPANHSFYSQEQEAYCFMFENDNDGSITVSLSYVGIIK